MIHRKTEQILVIQTAFLGDVILTLPLINALRQNLPHAYIAVLVIPQTREILEGHAAVDEIITFDKKDKERSWPAFLRLVKKIKTHRFDVVFLPHRSFKSALLTCLAKIPRRIGFDISEGALLLTDRVEYRRGIQVHEIERNLDLLKPLNLKERKPEFGLAVSKEMSRENFELLERHQIVASDLVIGINPGSVWPTKRFPVEKYAALADRLINTLKAKVIIIGSETDVDVAKKMEKNMQEIPINLAGTTTIKQVMTLMKRFNVLVTNDCGAMHIAVALGVPLVAIFGPTSSVLGFYPCNRHDLIVEKALPCRPCGRHGGNRCPKKHFGCMKLITVSEVFDAVKRRLEK